MSMAPVDFFHYTIQSTVVNEVNKLAEEARAENKLLPVNREQMSDKMLRRQRAVCKDALLYESDFTFDVYLDKFFEQTKSVNEKLRQ